MFEASELRVKPVRRYRTPRYPSHADPDPTLHPTPVPYPASSKLLAAVAAMGVAASTSCSEPATNHAAPSGTSVAAPLDATDPTAVSFPPSKLPVTTTRDLIKGPPVNPFTVALSGLPHRTSPYGTGMPHYLDEAIARRAIEETFQQAGYHLTARHRYHQGDVALVADGFDVEKKVGYVVAYYPNLDGDAIISGMRQPNPLASAEEAVKRLLGGTARSAMPATLEADIQAAKNLPDPARREAAYRAILVQASHDKISLAEMTQLEDPAKHAQDFVAVVSLFDRRFQVRAFAGPIIDEEILKQLEPSKGQIATEESATSVPAEEMVSHQELEMTSERATLQRLQQAVREYIAWARSQGAQ